MVVWEEGADAATSIADARGIVVVVAGGGATGAVSISVVLGAMRFAGTGLAVAGPVLGATGSVAGPRLGSTGLVAGPRLGATGLVVVMDGALGALPSFPDRNVPTVWVRASTSVCLHGVVPDHPKRRLAISEE